MNTNTALRSALTVALAASVSMYALARPPAVVTRRARPHLVVHEWGTFTTFSGHDGVGLELSPPGNDLPSFVHAGGRAGAVTKSAPDRRVTVSMETPVVYVHADAPIDLAFRVELLHGSMTDVFPRGSVRGGVLEWPRVHVSAESAEGERAVFPDTGGPRRYYEARKARASALSVEVEEGAEREGFLFYRGVGDFAPPLRVQAEESRLAIENTADSPVSGAVVVRVEKGAARFVSLGEVRAHTSVSVDVPRTPVDPERTLDDALHAMLVRSGLNPDEAAAMVATWKADWFGEEGTRVLYVLPTQATEAILPMTITPQPDALVRVLVGRHDILLPREEAALREALRGGGKPAEQARARLGRFARGLERAP